MFIIGAQNELTCIQPFLGLTNYQFNLFIFCFANLDAFLLTFLCPLPEETGAQPDTYSSSQQSETETESGRDNVPQTESDTPRYESDAQSETRSENADTARSESESVGQRSVRENESETEREEPTAGETEISETGWDERS